MREVITFKGDKETWRRFTSRIKRSEQQIWPVLEKLLETFQTDIPVNTNRRFNVLCRTCSEEMWQPSVNILAAYCKKCHLKATVVYERTPVVQAIGDFKRE